MPGRDFRGRRSAGQQAGRVAVRPDCSLPGHPEVFAIGDMVDLATSVWICGTAVSDRAINDTAERFGLSETARWVMRYRLTGPRASGAPVLLLLSTNEGRYEQHLVNTLGPIELFEHGI